MSVSDWHRVLWHEGMYLLPQQFQQWDRSQQQQLLRVGELAQAYPWGFTDLAIDDAALNTGQVRVTRCAGVFGDGFAFELPAGGELPAGRALPDAGGECRVALGLPDRRSDGPLWSEAGIEAGEATRFCRRDAQLRDGSPGGLEDPIALAMPQLRILFNEEIDTGNTVLPIGTFVRGGGGNWSLAEDAAPPSLHISAWQPLRDEVARLHDFLVTRSGELVAQRRERTAGAVEFSISEISQVLLALAVNRSIPLLADALDHGRTHPHTIHLCLAALLGEASTLGVAAPVPLYRHRDPLGSLRGLQALLREALGTSAPTRYVPLRLQAVNDRISKADIPAGLCDDGVFYLDLFSPVSADQLMNQVPASFKVTSAGRIGALVAKALRGVELTYLSVPPSEIPARPDHHYFELQPTGSEWDEIRNASTIAVYTPPDLGEIGLELLAVRR
ncbi:MAG: type VI secretion system baseplate subunit TssK [Planctomycetota bacterium]|jgi:type VI secretion system protein ImpJ|nr:type VI secretion system baseplate subunit TssK [Planctomycetota bacterium]